MKKVAKLILIILSYSPIATVAVAAQAKANEIEGENQSAAIQQIVNGIRSRLIPPGQLATSMEDAKNLYAGKTGLQGAELESNMQNDLAALAKAGLIQFNEKSILAIGPSEHSFE